jgi:hypothetical protein
LVSFVDERFLDLALHLHSEAFVQFSQTEIFVEFIPELAAKLVEDKDSIFLFGKRLESEELGFKDQGILSKDLEVEFDT